MARSREMTLSLPPFTRAVIWLLAANTAVFLLLELFSIGLPDIVRWVFDTLSLRPEQVVLHFDANGRPNDVAPRSDLLRLPLLGLTCLVINWVLGIWVHPRERSLAARGRPGRT